MRFSVGPQIRLACVEPDLSMIQVTRRTDEAEGDEPGVAAVGDRAHVHRPAAGPRRAVRLQEPHRVRGAPLQLCGHEQECIQNKDQRV